MSTIFLPTLDCPNRSLSLAFRIAVGDVVGNIRAQEHGVYKAHARCLDAGLEYGVWTRDAAINSWYGSASICRSATRNALMLRLVEDEDGNSRLGGNQYWDAIIWASGAWEHYLISGETDFLQLAYKVIQRSLAFFESTEMDLRDGLFRGPAVYGDGTSAYPDRYDNTGSGGIHFWPRHNASKVALNGEGLPMKCLSTNCIYYRAYTVLEQMADLLGEPLPASIQERKLFLRESINETFWDAELGRYRYLVDEEGVDSSQEGLGQAFAILCDVADAQQAQRIMENCYRTPHGVPCLWPPFERFRRYGEQHYGRHSGPVWPHVNGFFALAALKTGRYDIFAEELKSLGEKAFRDRQFVELYHPETGLPYGGLQHSEPGFDAAWHGWCHVGRVVDTSEERIVEWYSAARQTWCAMAYIAMLTQGVIGLQRSVHGLRFAPNMPDFLGGHLEMRGLSHREMHLNIRISGQGQRLRTFRLNGAYLNDPILPLDLTGEQSIEIEMEA